MAAMSIFGQIGGVKLKKTKTVEKTMFKKSEGTSTTSTGTGASSSSSITSDKRKALSKFIDFPGDVEEVKRHLGNPTEVNPAGTDAYGLTALHKFASWNKTILMEMLLPYLSSDELNSRCPDGKTALHWAVEMAAVASVKLLLRHGADLNAFDNKGRTVTFILDNSGESGIIDRLKAALVSPESEGEGDDVDNVTVTEGNQK
jgi:ankyrin repeat protein